MTFASLTADPVMPHLDTPVGLLPSNGPSGLTASDLFCGAGGSAIGLHKAGIEVVIAANHWKMAVETHQLNFPNTRHDVADISQVDPRRYPATDILWASPECTNHSQAKGVSRKLMQDAISIGLPAEAAERSRATMWDVPRFIEAMALRGRPYKAIIVENVVEARMWGPGGTGALFDVWIMAITSMGYEHQVVFLNSAFAGGGRFAGILPAPQFRDRMYVVFWRKGAPRPNLDIRPAGFCGTCETEVTAVQSWKNGKTWGRYRFQYNYRCPQCSNVVEPYTVPALAAIDWSLAGMRIGDRDRPLAEGTMRRIQAGLDRYGANSLLVPLDRNKDPNKRARSVDEPFGTLTTRATLGLAMPFVASLRGGGSKNKVDLVTGPLATVTASGNHHLLVNPDPEAWALTLPYYRTGVAHPVNEPVGTLTTTDRHAVVIPPGFVMRNNGSHGGPGGEHCTPFHEPIRTLTTKGHQSVVVGIDIDDCEFRMLQPHEQGAAMAFPSDYQVVGNKRERTRQFGNAVTPPASQVLATAVAAALAQVETGWDSLVA